MELTHADASICGPVRETNEDCVGFWRPAEPDKLRDLGAIAVVADGVGGQVRGEVASALAVQTALELYRGADDQTEPKKLLKRIFDTASQVIYDDGLKNRAGGKMCTTLTAAILRHTEITIGYVGDTRAYLVRPGSIFRLTNDHSYIGIRLRYGLIKENDAMTSPSRSQLTRTLGMEPICNFETVTREVVQGDVIVLCTDGVYGFATESEIWDIATHHEPAQAVKQILRLVERRNGEDNISVQVIRVDRVHRAKFFRGMRTGYLESKDVEQTNDLTDGSLLDNRFEILGCINRSGMASIYKATDTQRNEIVALKVPHRHLESDVATFNRFEREEQIGRSLKHPSILRIIPVDEKSRPYIVMEYLEGQTLAQLIKEKKLLPEPEAARIASRICDGLEYLHKSNVIHRDLKPENVMLCSDGSLRIMDFGIAKSSQGRRLTFVGFSPTMGTPDYMAPEQVQGKRGDERTDIYSLGAILYEMATGANLFEGENPYVVMNSRLTGDPVAPRKVNPKLTPVMEEIILHALERNPAERYQSAAEMKEELDDYEKVQLTGRWERLRAPQLWRSKFKLLPIILGIVGFQIILFLLLWWLSSKKGH